MWLRALLCLFSPALILALKSIINSSLRAIAYTTRSHLGHAVESWYSNCDVVHTSEQLRRPDASSAHCCESEPPDRRRPAVCRSARAPHGGVDAQLDRHR